MSRATNSLRIYALFLAAFGAVFTLAPNFLLQWVRIEDTNEPWIRMMGILTMAMGLFYWRAAQSQLKPFYTWSVGIRLFVSAAIIVLVALQFGPPALLGFAAFETVFALWTWTDLRADKPKTAPDKKDPLMFSASKRAEQHQ